MQIAYFSDINKNAWDEVCESSDYAWLFHHHDWIQRETCLLSANNESFAIIDDLRIIAIQPLYFNDSVMVEGERLIHSGIHRHTGLALANDLTIRDARAVQRAVMHQIFTTAAKYNADRIQLNVQNATPASCAPYRQEIPFWVSDYGFYLGLHFSKCGCAPVPGMATCNADQIVCLSDSEEILFNHIDESCRRAIRKAQKNGLTIELDKGSSDVSEYYYLARLSAERTKENLLDIDYYQSLYDMLSLNGRCRILFARYKDRLIGSLFLLLYKGFVHFMAGVSDPVYLPLRVNDFMHWSAISWSKKNGYQCYRLGPIFPELPDNWPVAKVSRFKGKFGGRNVPIIQGSYFINPEKYLNMAKTELESICEARDHNKQLEQSSSKAESFTEEYHASSLINLLAQYGLRHKDTDNLKHLVLRHVQNGENKKYQSAQRSILYRSDLSYLSILSRKQIYKPLYNYTDIILPDISSLLETSDGASVVAEYNKSGQKKILMGIDLIEELKRYRQGNPERVETVKYKGGLGFDYERPNYLYDDQLDQLNRAEPWADNLGFLIAEQLARITDVPLIEPLPEGMKGLVILTGDDDQAYLEKYEEQLRIIGDTPITYFLHPLTKHTSETLAKLPSNVEIGVHPDALEKQDKYNSLCEEQTLFVRELSKRPTRTVRNHGFLNDGYWGHLKTWEKCGLELDVNLPGVDGTALNGSFLPFRVQRPDGTWSEHYTLLTAFGDGMVFALGMTEKQATSRIRNIARQIEKRNPGVLVFNLHPQNIDSTRRIHEEVVKLAHRKGWKAMGLESYLDWLKKCESLTIEKTDDGCIVHSNSNKVIDSIVLKIPVGKTGWRRFELEPWTGSLKVIY